MDGLLRRLNHSGRKHSSLLDLFQQRIDVFAAGKWACEDVGGRDRILDGEIDAHSPDWGHGVRRITDRDQARTPPPFEPVERDGKQLDLVPFP